VIDFFCKRCHANIEIGSLKCPECKTKIITGVDRSIQKIVISAGFVLLGLLFIQLTMTSVGYLFFAIGVISWLLNIKWIKQSAARVSIKTDINEYSGMDSVVAFSVQGWNEKNIEKLENEIIALSTKKNVLSDKPTNTIKLNREYFNLLVSKIKNTILQNIQGTKMQNEVNADNLPSNEKKESSTKDKYCSVCKKYVTPTFHGLCPICDSDIG
jgi:uncharacterized paraquat-inducible protein A